MNKINFDPIILTQALVQCPSITPKDEGALNIIQAHLASLDFNCTRLPFSDKNSYDVDNLFATIGSGDKHLAFAGHTDVVPRGTTSVCPAKAKCLSPDPIVAKRLSTS